MPMGVAHRHFVSICSEPRKGKEWLRVFVEGVSGEPMEDPVKNGTCQTKVRHRRWLRLRSLPFRVRRGSE